jgi:hypothetical protein
MEVGRERWRGLEMNAARGEYRWCRGNLISLFMVQHLTTDWGLDLICLDLDLLCYHKVRLSLLSQALYGTCLGLSTEWGWSFLVDWSWLSVDGWRGVCWGLLVGWVFRCLSLVCVCGLWFVVGLVVKGVGWGWFVLGVLDGEFLVEVGAGALKQDRS